MARNRLAAISGLAVCAAGAAWAQPSFLNPQPTPPAIPPAVATPPAGPPATNPRPGTGDRSSGRAIPTPGRANWPPTEISPSPAVTAPPPLAPVPAPRHAQSTVAAKCGMADQVTAFVNSYFANGSGDTSTVLAYLQGAYAEQVIYYGRLRSKADVLQDKKYYFQRWPVRSAIPRPSSARIDCDPSSSTYSFTAEVDWSVDNPPHPGKKGSSLVSLGIRISGSPDKISIVRENSTIAGRQGSIADPKAVPAFPPVTGNGFANDTLKGPGQITNGRFVVAGRPLALFGLDGFASTPADLARSIDNWLKRKGDLTCDRMLGVAYRCVTGTEGGSDVGQFALLNGAARATPDSTPAYRDAETQARQTGKGVWSNAVAGR